VKVTVSGGGLPQGSIGKVYLVYASYILRKLLLDPSVRTHRKHKKGTGFTLNK